MDNTTDSLQISKDDDTRQQMSYLFGRDPSILAYNQRPMPCKDTKKNLLSVYEVEESTCLEDGSTMSLDSPMVSTVKVYLRIKPIPKNMKITEEQQQAYKITSSTTLFTRLPVLDMSSLNRASNDMVCRKFMFTRTFGPTTTQLELFEQAVKQQMVDFLAGQNSTIMTYGTTNSGKSYTLQGTTTSPGIIPRSLEFVFSNIRPKAMPSYKPVHHCDVVSLDPMERAQELEVKSKLLTIAPVDKYQYINAYKEMQKLLQEESPIRPSQCNDTHYSVWVSFAEIYNETVFDLLSNECQKKRTPLKLATDNQGRAFIKGLKTVCVNSGSEAYQVLMAGQYNLKVAATALNARSSRSHCIFTIKLLKYHAENRPDTVEVSTFAFCDLAGSERLKKTLNVGDRLKEAQNINTSLLVLGRCLKSIHEGQLTKQKYEHAGPFRESKLTRLFQRALSGKEHLALIVNINPLPNLYVETQNVLSFSAIAKKIVIEKKEKTKKARSRFSQIVAQSIKSVTDWDMSELGSEEWQSANKEDLSEYIDPSDYDDLVNENSDLKKEIARLKSGALIRDLEIRQEMAETYSTLMKELESDWKNRIKDVEEQHETVLAWSVKQVEDFYKQKLGQLSSRKRRRSDFSDSSDDSVYTNVKELELENSRLTSKVVSLKSTVKELKERNQNLEIEKNQANFELSLTKEELKTAERLLSAAQQDVCSDKETEDYVDELRLELSAKQEQVKKLKVFLNEAKEEFIRITTEMQEKECVIKKQEELILENEDKIEELEEHLEQVNICLVEKTKVTEMLEEKLDSQIKEVDETENERAKMADQPEILSDEKQEEHDTKLEESNNGDSSEGDIHIKQEVSCGLSAKSLDELVHESCKETQTECANSPHPEDEKFIAVTAENAALKEKLAQSKAEIESLKGELQIMKEELKNISDQISVLKANEDKNKDRRLLLDQSDQIKLFNTEEVGCQVEMQTDKLEEKVEEEENAEERNETEATKIEGATQTSFVADSAEEDLLDEWAQLAVKYADLKREYEEKRLMVEELTERIPSMEEQIKVLSENCNVSEVVIEEYKQSVELLQSELSSMKKTKANLEELLSRKELSSVKECKEECIQQLQITQEEFNSIMSKCKAQYDGEINELRKELSLAQEKSSIKEQCLTVHAEKITELERIIESVTSLEEKISELSQKLEVSEAEKRRLQSLFDANNERLLELEDRLEEADSKEHEKEAEIAALQSEMKRMIQQTEGDQRSDTIMEQEMKSTIRDLTRTRELLFEKETCIENLQMQLKSYENNVKMLELNVEKKQAESKRLQTVSEELKSRMLEMEREMESFVKHRDEMVEKYESLVKSQQEELEEQKKQLTKYTSKSKDYYGNTSDDESVVQERKTRGRRGRKPATTPSTQNEKIAVIDLCSSDNKQNTKHLDLPPPNSEPESEKKRGTRKKKLFVQGDDSFKDLEPLETTVTVTPCSQPRTLRSRRK